MMTVQSFHFNSIQVNTYVLFDETLEAVIIDPGNCCLTEDEQLTQFIGENHLRVRNIVNTHPHIDHIYGNQYCKEHYPEADILLHKLGIDIYSKASVYGAAFGFLPVTFPMPVLIDEGRVISFGHQKLEVIYTPGHCDGSVCLVDKANHSIFVGDLLFEGSIGRSDLPTGNHTVLRESLTKIFQYDENMIIYPGHGGTTTLRKEKQDNPFLRFLK